VTHGVQIALELTVSTMMSFISCSHCKWCGNM